MPQNEAKKLLQLRKMIYHGSYVDNIFVGCNSKDKLRYIHDKSSEIFEANMFPLQQFVTNDADYQIELDRIHDETTTEVVNVLGMKWNRVTNQISAPVHKMNVNVSTKRQILKELNSNYDLMNMNLPVLNRAKLFLRSLQLDSKINWDDHIGSKRIQLWNMIVNQYNAYEPAKIQ